MANSYNNRVAMATTLASSINRVIETSGEIPTNNWTSGANVCGYNSGVIAINSGATGDAPNDGFDNQSAAGTPIDSRWTLLDQYGSARTPQAGVAIGGTAFVERDPNSIGDYRPWPESGGSPLYGSGNGGNDLGTVAARTNPDNIADPDLPGGYYPDPEAPLPTKAGDMTLATLAAGWVAVV